MTPDLRQTIEKLETTTRQLNEDYKLAPSEWRTLSDALTLLRAAEAREQELRALEIDIRRASDAAPHDITGWWSDVSKMWADRLAATQKEP